MQLDITQSSGLVVLTPLEARIDMTAADDFEKSLRAQFAEGHPRILINMERVEFIDSSGLGAFVSAITKSGRAGDITVCGLTGRVRRTFDVTRVNRVIQVSDACPLSLGAPPPVGVTTSAVLRALASALSATR